MCAGEPSFQSLQACPYSDACLRESLRLFPPISQAATPSVAALDGPAVGERQSPPQQHQQMALNQLIKSAQEKLSALREQDQNQNSNPVPLLSHP